MYFLVNKQTGTILKKQAGRFFLFVGKYPTAHLDVWRACGRNAFSVVAARKSRKWLLLYVH